MEKHKILVVDDDPDIIHAIETILTMSGYSVITAENGHECLDCAAHEQPDLVLLDLMLPDMHGTMVAQKLRLLSDHLMQVPIIVISAAHEAKQIAASMEAIACIEKPFELNELLNTVANSLS